MDVSETASQKSTEIKIPNEQRVPTHKSTPERRILGDGNQLSWQQIRRYETREGREGGLPAMAWGSAEYSWTSSTPQSKDAFSFFSLEADGATLNKPWDTKQEFKPPVQSQSNSQEMEILKLKKYNWYTKVGLGR